MSKKTDKQLAASIDALAKAINRLAASHEAKAPRLGGGGGTWTQPPWDGRGGPNISGGGGAGSSAVVRVIGSNGGGAGAAAEIPA